MTKEESKQNIIRLVHKYQTLDQQKIKSFNEAATKQGFIQPLFDALGWNFTDTDEVSPEDNTSNGRVDFAFKLHGISQFFVEAKSFKEDLNDPKYVKQTISYAYNKGVTWAVLTNFHHTRVFNAQKTEPFISIGCDQYEADFDRLWLLSRQSLSSGLLNQEAIKWGVLPIPIPIEKRLYSQMRVWREQLFNQIFRYNYKLGVKPKDADEVIQKLFHRLIFIRTAEDRGIEEKGLLALLHQWKSGGAKGRLIDALRQLFKEYDGYYDSELFDHQLHHFLDNPEIFIENDVIESIIVGLYEIPGSMATYNFNDIDADVLGAVYEQYLGHVAEVLKQRAKEAQIKMDLGIVTYSYTLTAKKERRREQGIYYTPKIITDFIVRETVGRYLRDNSGYPDKLHNIKVLDPACGSGSFLIRAYDELLRYHAKELNKPLEKLDQWERLPILTNSIFGVDLDKQAVEITRLNLLLRSLAHREPLPFLGDNIKQGNSLVSGTKELEKYFGAGWQGKRPFDWQDQFSSVMAKGGFDIIIGNPPYIRQEQLGEYKPLWQKDFECYDGLADIYVYFFERGIQLLKPGGLLAYISPNKYFRSGYGRKLREYLSTKTKVVQVIDFGDAPLFEAIAYPSIIVLRKSPPESNQTRVLTWNPNQPLYTFATVVASNSSLVGQHELSADGWRFASKTTLYLQEKLGKAGKPLGEYVNGRLYYGIKTGLNEAFVVDKANRERLIQEHPSSTELLKPLLRGRDIKRWCIDFAELYLIKIESSDNKKHPWSGKSADEAEIIFCGAYPAIYSWLTRYHEALIRRDDQGKYFWELRSCKYWGEFEFMNIMWGNLATKPQFTLVNGGFYNSAPANLITSDSKYLLGILNSQITRYLVAQSAAQRQGGFLEFKPMYISPLAIPDPPKDEQVTRLVRKILSFTDSPDYLENCIAQTKVTELEREIDQNVYQLYGLTEQEIAVVEGNVR